jgi:hypothetical protein
MLVVKTYVWMLPPFNDMLGSLHPSYERILLLQLGKHLLKVAILFTFSIHEAHDEFLFSNTQMVRPRDFEISFVN